MAKAEVKRWPLIGWGGTAMRTLWVKRSDAESRRETRREVQRRIESGMSIIIFRLLLRALPLKYTKVF